MSLKDIEKLKERVEKDPNSKMFVPLAEEYKKEGMLDEAINVLISGLEKQPTYTSARVSLGKIYLEKGMQQEATSEFEQVIRQIPDNLYAQKKLAEIYKDTGRTDLAIRSFRAVLKLNPLDEDAISKLKEIEGPEAEAEPQVKEEPQHKVAAFSEEDFAEEASVTPEIVSGDETPTAPHVDEKDLTAFKHSLFGNAEAETLDEPEDLVSSEDIAEDIIKDIPVTSHEEENIEVIEETIQIPEDEISFSDLGEALEYVEPGPEDPEEKIKVEETTEKPVEIKQDIQEPSIQGIKVEDADKHISRGSYLEAMKIYRGILSSAPNDKKVLQRIEELRSLMKLTGKDKELLISKLNTFQEGINKRQDEFLRSS